MGTTSFPTSADDFATTSPTNLGDSDSKGRTHSERHDDMEAAMEAVQAGGFWADYTPTWTATGTSPTLGNGSLIGRYARFGKTVIASGRLTIGSSTTVAGSSFWFFDLPSDCPGYNALTTVPRGLLRVSDSSTGTSYVGAVDFADGLTKITPRLANSSATYATSANVTETVPITWATGDILEWQITYETSA